MKTETQGTVLVDEPRWIQAHMNEIEGGLIIIGYASVLVEETDPVVAPIADAVGYRCVNIEHDEIIEDPDMYFGEARFVRIRVFDTCPGPGVCLRPHNRHEG